VPVDRYAPITQRVIWF